MLYRPTSLWTWTLLMATVIEIGAVLVIEVVIFANFQLHLYPGLPVTASTKTIPTFLTLLIFGFIYQCLLLYETLAQRNTIQLIGLCAYAACLCIYSGLQVQEIQGSIENLISLQHIDSNSEFVTNTQSLALVNASMTAVYTLAITFVSFKLYNEFQWTIYRQLNADLDMQKRYFTFKIYTTILKFDFFFFAGFLVQLITIETGLEDVEFGLTVAALPITLITLIASAWFMRRENKPGMLVILCLHLALLGFFVFKFARMYEPSHLESYLPVRRILTFFGIITILLGVVTIVIAVKCIANFNKGLKIHVTSNKLARNLLEDHEMEMSVFYRDNG